MDTESFLQEIQMLPDPTMWGRILYFNYEDYTLKEERRRVLKLQVQGLIVNLSVCDFLHKNIINLRTISLFPDTHAFDHFRNFF